MNFLVPAMREIIGKYNRGGSKKRYAYEGKSTIPSIGEDAAAADVNFGSYKWYILTNSKKEWKEERKGVPCGLGKARW